MTKPKYKQGARINSVAEFEACKSQLYKWNGKTLHKQFLMSWQYRSINEVIKRGKLFIADRIEEEDTNDVSGIAEQDSK